MRSFLRVTTIVAIVAMVGVGVRPAQAEIVSANMFLENTSTPSVGSTEMSGVVPAANWNNLTVNNPNPASGSPYMGLIDSDGNSTSVQVAFENGSAQSWNTIGNPDGRLYGDFVQNLSQMTISDLPANAGVTLYTYHGSWGDNVIDVTVNGETKQYNDSNFDNGVFGNNLFNTSGNPGFTEGENYLRFDLPSTTSITLGFANAAPGGSNRSLNAFQVVTQQIPEPSTVVLLGMSLLGLLLVRRRK